MTQPPENATHWTGRAIARRVGIALESVGNFVLTPPRREETETSDGTT